MPFRIVSLTLGFAVADVVKYIIVGEMSQPNRVLHTVKVPLPFREVCCEGPHDACRDSPLESLEQDGLKYNLEG